MTRAVDKILFTVKMALMIIIFFFKKEGLKWQGKKGLHYNVQKENDEKIKLIWNIVRFSSQMQMFDKITKKNCQTDFCLQLFLCYFFFLISVL